MSAKVLLRLSIAALLVGAGATVTTTARGAWPADPTVNVAISRISLQEEHAVAVTDGADGAIVIWQVLQGGAWGYDLAAQRVDANGTIMWSSPANVCSALGNQRDHQAISDGAGGAIIVWSDERTDAGDIYAQRIDASGNVLWPPNGLVIANVTNVQAYPQLVSDGAGGAIIVWRDSRNFNNLGADIYAQRVTAPGSPRWTTNGLPICAWLGNQLEPAITTDWASGAVIAWMDDRNAADTGTDVYFQRVNANGITLWPENGVGYLAYGNQRWLPLNAPLVSDGSGGAIVAWDEDYYGADDHDIRALRIDAAGDFPWMPHNLWVCGSNGNQFLRDCAGDGLGNMVITWRDDRYGLPDTDIFGQLIDASGTMHWAGGWSNGICTTSDPQEDPEVVLDESGSAVVTWTDERSGSDIYAQRMSATGGRMWTWNGVPVCTEPHGQHSPAMAPAGPCGAVIAWTDYRWVGIPGQDTSWDIYGQRVYCEGSLSQFIHVDVPNGGEVWNAGTTHNITWHCEGISNHDVLIQYSTDGGANFHMAGIVTQVGTAGSFPWLIPNAPSTQCLVQLSVPMPEGSVADGSDGMFTIAGGVGIADRPAPVALTLELLSPNPAFGPVTFEFGLPGPTPVELSVYDVGGRLVSVLLDGQVPAGWRRLHWDRMARSGQPAPCGIYVCVLRTPGAKLTRKLVLLD